MDAVRERFPTRSSVAIADREWKKQFAQLIDLRNSEALLEREYYFDEGLGQSLNEHIHDLKARFPGVKLETRRDRDGYALVRLSFKPKFKYNLDDIINTDAEEMKRIQMETQEAILTELMPDDPREFMKKIGRIQLGEGKGLDPEDLVDKDSAAKVKDLVHQRMFGIFKNDLDGFVHQLR